MRQTLYDYCMEHKKEALLKEWDAVKNAPLTPKDFSYGSKKKVWLLCGKGHSWQAPAYSRTSGSGCPVCAGRQPRAGENDLSSQRPDLIAQWDFEKNAGFSPENVSVGSHRKVWWRCEKGHEWRAMVKSRCAGAGCPFCAGKRIMPGENDLATTNPKLAAEWHPAKNGELTPADVLAGTQKKVWWLCEKGHEWRANISSRARGMGCPVCAGKLIVPGENDLESFYPDIAAQWHPEKNDGLTPQMVAPYSNRRVWWKCRLGHEYQAAVGARAQGSGCPYCAGRRVLAGFNDLATLEPEVASQWHQELNGELTPQMVTSGSHKKVWWKCSAGHVWDAVISSRTGNQRCGCPVCAGNVSRKRMERYKFIMND